MDPRARFYSFLTKSSQRVTCPLPDGRPLMPRRIQGQTSASCFGKGSYHFPWGVSVRECSLYCKTAQ
jgi:hypothetical protein